LIVANIVSRSVRLLTSARNGETSGSKRLLSACSDPLFKPADGDARALSVEFLRRGQPDPAVAPVIRIFLFA